MYILFTFWQIFIIIVTLLGTKEYYFFMNISVQFQEAVEQNNIEKVKVFLGNKKLDPSFNRNICVKYAVNKGFSEIVKLLLKDNRVDPACTKNYAITTAYDNKYFDIVNLLWKNQKIKDTLKDNNPMLYNELIKKDQIKEKVEEF
tara:strand:- start:1011 stop:1445 length:435 start_codon:yes stop_codon:yes gene_type:complete